MFCCFARFQPDSSVPVWKIRKNGAGGLISSEVDLDLSVFSVF